jgi:hypothetical protein
VARKHGMGWILPSILVGLGTIATDLGDHQRAIGWFHESMTLAQSRGNLSDVVDAIEGLGRLAAAIGQVTEAARLFGATDTMRETLGTPRAPSQENAYAPIENALREALGADRLAAVRAEGRSLSQQDAIAAALAVRVYQ